MSFPLWSRLANRVRSWFEVPYGYEDENGFHYGPEPTPAWFRPQAASKVLTDRAHEAMTYPTEVAVPSVEEINQSRPAAASAH